MLQSRIEIYDTPKLQYRVCFHAVRRGYIVTVPALPELLELLPATGVLRGS